ncbi:MAG: hypothetical protein E6I66_03485 [Chloroflexi bacterium]|nr:MAG: hypothetical protein E6I66_03485 [Chloroflexota bacterium]
MPVRAVAGIAAAGLLMAVALAAYLSPATKAPTPSPTSEPSNEASVAEFIRTHSVASAPSPDRFAWLLSDVVGTVILPEDETVPAAVLTGIGRPEVSRTGRHLTYWTNEARGMRQLHIFDTNTFATPRVILETDIFTKLPLLWSADERFVAFPLPERPTTTRVVDLVDGTSVEGGSTAIGGLSIWSRPGNGPAPDPGTTMKRVISRVARPDGSATTYLDFDSSAGGRWFGERVEVATGARTPVEWSFGGNPEAVIRIGQRSEGTAQVDQAPPRDAAGKMTADGALWSFRQSVRSPVRREAVRGMPYAEYSKSAGSYMPVVPLDLVVYLVVIEVEEPVDFSRGGVSCRELFAVLRSDGRGEGSSGGCMGNSWPTDRLPPAFATPDPRDWSSPKGPPTPGPSTSPSIRR